MENITTRYTDSELDEFKRVIEAKIAAARNEYEALTATLRAADVTDERPSIEEADTTFEKEQAYQMAARQKKFIEQLEAALGRIANKTYGVCRQTGQLIQKERLLAVPHTTLSMAAKMEQ